MSCADDAIGGTAKRWFAALVAATAVLITCTRPPESSPPPELISGTQRIVWDQPATGSADMATLGYSLYVDNVRTELPDSSCATDARQPPFPCSATLPNLPAGRHTLQIAAFRLADRTLESPRSSPLVVIVSVTTTRPAEMRSATTFRTSDGVVIDAKTIATGITEPTDLATPSDGRIFVAQRAGTITIIDGERVPRAAPAFEDVAVDGAGGGLLAVDISPEFGRNHYVYGLYTTRGGDGRAVFRIARLREVAGTFADSVVLFDAAAVSGRPSATLRFGPDGTLFAAFDDGGSPTAKSDLAVWNGKTIRLNADGTTPDAQANRSPLFSYAYTSPRALAWSGALWLADQAGQAMRLNAIEFSNGQSGPGISRAVYSLDSPDAAAMAAYRHDLIPAFHGDLFVATGHAGQLLRIRFDPHDAVRIAATERLRVADTGRVNAVAVSPSGLIYLAIGNDIWRLAPAGAAVQR